MKFLKNDPPRMTRLVLCELYGHHEVLRELIGVFGTFSELELVVLCREKVRERLPESLSASPTVRMIVARNEERIDEFLQRALRGLSADFFLAVTVEAHTLPQWLRIRLPGRLIWMVHNLHAVADPVGTLRPTTLRNVYHLWRYGLRPYEKFLKRVELLCFPDPGMEAYFSEQQYSQHALFPSPPLYTPLASKPRPGAVRCLIPGTIARERLDLDLLLTSIRSLAGKEVSIEWVFPGRDRVGLDRLLKDYPVLMTHSREGTTAAEYERHLTECDLILLPLRSSQMHLGRREQLGLSKISGGINDARRVGVDLIVPAHYGAALSYPGKYFRYAAVGELLDLLIDRIGMIAEKKKTNLNSRSSTEEWYRRQLAIFQDRCRQIFSEGKA